MKPFTRQPGEPAGDRRLHERAEAQLDALVDDRLEEAPSFGEGDVVELLVVELDEVDGHERAATLRLEGVRELVGEALLGDRLGPGAGEAAVTDEGLRGPDAVEHGRLGRGSSRGRTSATLGEVLADRLAALVPHVDVAVARRGP